MPRRGHRRAERGQCFPSGPVARHASGSHLTRLEQPSLSGAMSPSQVVDSRHSHPQSTAQGRPLLRHSARRRRRAGFAYRGGMPRAARPRGPRQRGVRFPDARRAPFDRKRSRRHHSPGSEGGGLGRRPGEPRARAAEQGDARVPHPLRLRSRRQRVRRSCVPARAILRGRSGRPRRPRPRPRLARDGSPVCQLHSSTV